MLIYNSGYSVGCLVKGVFPKYKTFTCVEECHNSLSTQEAFVNMQIFLRNKGIIIATVNNGLFNVTSDTGDIYSLSVERTLSPNGVMTFTKSSFIRDLSTKLFTKDSLYVDECGQIVSIIDESLQDVQDNVLRSTMDNIETFYENNGDCVNQILKAGIADKSNYSTRIRRMIESVDIKNTPDCEEFVSFLIRNYYTAFERHLSYFPKLKCYIENCCNCSIATLISKHSLTKQ